MKEKIQDYWEQRAKQYSRSSASTTNDIYLRELEISTIIQTLHQLTLSRNVRILDVGCGDGYSTLKVAQVIPGRFLGFDYSENMIRVARKRLESQPDVKERVAFKVGDVTGLDRVCGESLYGVVLTVRCLINLESFETQLHAFAEIAKHTKPGGYFIAIENFIEGHESMNRMRRAVELPEIPMRWHNLYFKEDDFVNGVNQFFEDVLFKDFSSSYYFATRVVYSAMCQMRGEKPDYNHEIHQLAVRLPSMGQLSPIRMVVMRRRSG